MTSVQNPDITRTNGVTYNEPILPTSALPAGAPISPVTQSHTLNGTGTIYTYSIMYNVPQGFEEQKPYVIAIIQLDEGPMVTAQLTDIDHDEVAIGMQVEMVTRKLSEEGHEGQIVYGYKFRPLM